MARTKIEGVTCDRCCEEAQFEAHEVARAGWGWAVAKSRASLRVVGGEDEDGPADLCPICLAELERWFKGCKLRDADRGSAE